MNESTHIHAAPPQAQALTSSTGKIDSNPPAGIHQPRGAPQKAGLADLDLRSDSS
jgi:hypothetical protein